MVGREKIRGTGRGIGHFDDFVDRAGKLLEQRREDGILDTAVDQYGHYGHFARCRLMHQMNLHVGVLAVDGVFAGHVHVKLLQRVDPIADV